MMMYLKLQRMTSLNACSAPSNIGLKVPWKITYLNCMLIRKMIISVTAKGIVTLHVKERYELAKHFKTEGTTKE